MSSTPHSLGRETFAQYLTPHEGLHHVDWTAFYKWMGENVVPENDSLILDRALRLWLAQLHKDLGGTYAVLESENALLLINREADTSRWVLSYIEKTVVTIKRLVGDLAWRANPGPLVVLVFGDDADYYRYVSYHGPEGEEALSLGMCIHDGYTHVALPWQDEDSCAATIVHELTHASVQHLHLPLWLNEAIAQLLQESIAPPPKAYGEQPMASYYSATIDWRPPLMWQELAERHFEFWNEENIQEFWAGTSFYEPGDASELSYSLASVLLSLLIESFKPGDMNRLLQGVSTHDAGNRAVNALFKRDLGEIAGTFLGKGNWSPNVKKIDQCRERAGWSARAIDEPSS